MEKELLTVTEAAELLRTSPKGVYALVERGTLPGVVRIGRRVLLRAADLRRSLGLLPSPSLAVGAGSERNP